ncbi:MAG: translocation/assembly module TamB domain-containing protein [Bacteroidales bacterium]|nr:translocation/assembly module TamB domain-containing protein [Candidatus Sodaliphilus aphodohippi]
MADSAKNSIWSIVAKVLAALLLIVVLLPFSLYIPWVQNIVKDYACEWASEKTGLDISIDRILLKFPLDLSVDGVRVLNERRDTMVVADNLTAGIALMPLFDLNVNVDEATLTRGKYRMVSKDSSMLIRADVDDFVVKGIALDLNRNVVNIPYGHLTGGKVNLEYLPYKVVHEPDTAESKPWHIRAYQLVLDDVDYSMSMLPTIDKMTAHIAHVKLVDGIIDTGKRTVDARSLKVDSADVKYLYPNADFIAKYNELHPLPPDTVYNPADTIPWTIVADSVCLSNSHAVYALSGAAPKRKGLDMDYIDVNRINVSIVDFYNRGTDIVVPLRQLALDERSGFSIKSTTGTIAMDDRGIDIDSLDLQTNFSHLKLICQVDNDMLQGSPQGVVNVVTDSKLALQDVVTLFPEYSSVLNGIPQVAPISIKGALAGNTSQVSFKNLTAELPRYASAKVTGTLFNVTDFNKLSGNVAFDANFKNINFAKPTFMDKAMQRQVNLPPMAMNGKVNIRPGAYSGNVTMTVAGGKLVGQGSFNGKSKDYNVDATFTNFPVKAILPLMNTDNLTAHVKAKGHGFDFLSPNANITAQVDLGGVKYNNALYRNIYANVNLAGGALSGHLSSANPNCDLDVDVSGTMNGDHYVFDASGAITDLDANALGLYKGVCNGHARFTARGDIDFKKQEYDVTANFTDLSWQLDDDQFIANEVSSAFRSNANETYATFDNEDNHIVFSSQLPVETIINQFSKSADIAMSQYKERYINIDTLRQALPPFSLKMTMGTDGLAQRYFEKYNVDFRDVSLDMRNDSTIFIDGYVHSLSVGGTNIDTLTLHATEKNKYLAFDAHMGNRPGTMDEFAQVTVNGGVKGSTLDFLVTQQNINHEVGYRLGCNANLTERFVNMKLFPQEPVIGYRKWIINKDNYFNLDYSSNLFDADINLESDSSVVALKTRREDGASTEDVLLNVHNLRIEEWTKLIPGLDPMTGVVNADMDVTFDGRNMDGKGVLDLKNFTYNGMKEGDITVNTNFDYDPATSSTRLNADMVLDGSHVAVAYGSMNDSTANSPLNLTMKLDRFPLSKVSPFIPGNMVRLKGYLEGSLAVNGTTDNPVLDGYLEGDSAYVTLPRYGSSLRLSADRIMVDSNLVKFDNYKIIGLNEQPVKINGLVNLQDMTSPSINLSLTGRNVQFIGSEQRGFSEIFGKAFADVDASVKSTNNLMNIRADLALLAGSNITYVLQDEVSTIVAPTDENMVTFINFNDSIGGTPNLVTANGTYSSNIIANLDIQQGAKINAYITPDGKDRASIDGSGRLKYSLDFAGKDALTGTYTIESGSVRYSPPLISQKNFTLTQGSSVVWTGDMMNPQLNITGTEHVKTSVNDGDQGARTVDFLITAIVGGTLSNIKLDFDMSADGDMTAQNELQSMSDVQRSQAALNMLLYNTYSGTNSAGAVNNLTASAALFSFVQSQLNSWAAKSLKGVDLSFGINQYEGTKGKGTETSYSYRLSKNLFNDRFKIVVGGEYSTDASAEENFAQNLISDISFEYNLNASGNKYVRLFRHSGFESVLEGQVTETGVGFVMKRKVASLKDFFKLKSPKLKSMDSVAAPKQTFIVPLDSSDAKANALPTQTRKETE